MGLSGAESAVGALWAQKAAAPVFGPITEAEHRAAEVRARVARAQGDGVSQQRGINAFFSRSQTYVQDTEVPVALPAPPPAPLSPDELSTVRIQRWQRVFVRLKSAKKDLGGRPALSRAVVRAHALAHSPSGCMHDRRATRGCVTAWVCPKNCSRARSASTQV